MKIEQEPTGGFAMKVTYETDVENRAAKVQCAMHLAQVLARHATRVGILFTEQDAAVLGEALQLFILSQRG